jgi:two-component system cell cycle sensor histidine kinase/response regulator CckA
MEGIGYAQKEAIIDSRANLMITYSTVSQTALPSWLPVPATVLVVDDDPTNLLLTTRFLEKGGWAIMMASTPKHAVELFEQYGEAIDMVVTDVNMPEMDGYDLADLLRSRHPQLPVLCMSAAMEKEARRHDFPFISKPFTFFGLIQSVAAAMYSYPSTATTHGSC